MSATESTIEDIREAMKSGRFVFHCCFCDGEIEDRHIFTCDLGWPEEELAEGDAEGDGPMWQTWWCHRDCFVNALHPAYRMHPKSTPSK